MRRLRIILALCATSAAAEELRDPPEAFVAFSAATRVADMIDQRCEAVGWDQQGYIWASEQMWRILDAEGIGRHSFRDEIRPLTEDERNSVLTTFLSAYALDASGPDDVFCAAAAREARIQTVLGSIITNKE